MSSLSGGARAEVDVESLRAGPAGDRVGVDPRMRRRWVEVRRAEGRRRLRLLTATTAATVLVVSVLVVVHLPLFAARHVEIAGAAHTSRASVLAVTRLGPRTPLVDVSAGDEARRLRALPWVASASVTVHWPDTVAVALVERVPVAVALRPGGLALVDGTGRVLTWVVPPGTGLPTITRSGTWSGAAGRPGTWVASAAAPLLVVARSLPPALRGRVRSVAGGSQGPDPTVVLDLGGGLVASVGPDTDLPAKYEALVSVLSGVDPAGPATIDVSVPAQPTISSTAGAAHP